MRAKPAVPLAGIPLLARIIRNAAGYDVRRFVVNLHHLPDTITSRIGDASDLGVEVRYSWESPTVLGSAGGPRRALPLLSGDDFYIINGDTLSSVDLIALARQHLDTKALVTMAVIENPARERYGGVVTDAEGRVYGFVPRGSPAAKYHFVGVQMVHRSVFASLPDGEPAESVGAVYTQVIAAKTGNIRAFLASPTFYDVGTPADYLDAAFSIGAAEGCRGSQIGAGSVVPASARVTDSIIWDNVRIGEGAVLERCVVADGAHIPAGRQFRNCAIIQSGGELVVSQIVHG